MAHGFQSALSGSRFYQASGFAGGYDCYILFTDLPLLVRTSLEFRGKGERETKRKTKLGDI